MKNLFIRFGAISNITQEPQQLQKYDCACVFIRKSRVIHEVELSSIVVKSQNVLTGSLVSKSYQQLPPLPPLSFRIEISLLFTYKPAGE